MPVGLEKDLNPLGHSGHLRLQAVVGSIEIEMGSPFIVASFLRREYKYDNKTSEPFFNLFGVSFEISCNLSNAFTVTLSKPTKRLLSIYDNQTLFHDRTDNYMLDRYQSG